jgi:hypothetical protein
MKTTIKNIDGKVIRYETWLARVSSLADELNIPEEVRALATGAMLKDAWKQGDRPEYFLSTLCNLS